VVIYSTSLDIEDDGGSVFIDPTPYHNEPRDAELNHRTRQPTRVQFTTWHVTSASQDQ